uniref:BTB domain-containing protein n=1 Tax=Melanopsichium pennsylvanicum 4 TaxID=1398559 RepID=A0A077QZX2_9BASI|nr:hypothetical protein BN887_05793 [Melanopsichium pennsylvanicum 4]
MLETTMHETTMILQPNEQVRFDVQPKVEPITAHGLEPSDLWDVQVSGSPAEIPSDASDELDVNMVSATAEEDAVDKRIVRLIGQDDVEYRCMASDLAQQSAKLFDMIVLDEAGQARIVLPLTWSDLSLLVNSLQPHRLSSLYWSRICLDQLVRSTEILLSYGIGVWDATTLETAILERLNDRDPQDAASRPDLADILSFSDLRYAAQQAGMLRLVQLIDEHNSPMHTESYDSDERPRKRRKVSRR